MAKATQSLISDWLQERLSLTQWEWLQLQLEAVAHSNSDKALHIALGMAPRKLSKIDLCLSEAELAKAHAISAAWEPCDWSVDGAARILILLRVAEKNPDKFTELLESLCASADVSEAIIYYRAVGLFPNGQSFEALMGHGLRTNMRTVFEAIAHNNPYPAEYFDDHRWNHMILKALFIDSRLAPIHGLDERASPELADILCNYAHERWSANRSVSPELWRCVGPHATADMLHDLERASQSSDQNEHAGAMLALSQCNLPEAATYLDAYPETARKIANGDLTWDILATEMNIE